MRFSIYQTEKESKNYFYILFFATVLMTMGFYMYSRPLIIEAVCSEVSAKTSGLTKSFNYDPVSDYDQAKAKCLEDVFSTVK